ncbi:MAG: Mg2 transporter protein CorA family protein, partial [Sphingomonas bacterium]|nr:Mg2 transporter protein CorA family protein [Sphingomonas bacterium]
RPELTPAIVAALTAVETRPRTEEMGGGAIINLRGLGATPEDDPDKLVSVRLWAGRGRVFSVGYRSLAAMDAVCRTMAAGKVRDPGDLIAVLAVTITLSLDDEVAALGDLLDDCEVRIEPDQHAYGMRRLIGKARADAIAYRRFVVPQRTALERLAALDAEWLEEDDRTHLRDAADRFARMGEELEAVRERAALMHEQLTDLRAEQIDSRTLLLSIVALIFLPLTFITGLLGMNVEGIPFAHAPWAFSGVVLLCVLIAGAIGAYFIRSHWLKR